MYIGSLSVDRNLGNDPIKSAPTGDQRPEGQYDPETRNAAKWNSGTSANAHADRGNITVVHESAPPSFTSYLSSAVGHPGML